MHKFIPAQILHGDRLELKFVSLLYYIRKVLGALARSSRVRIHADNLKGKLHNCFAFASLFLYILEVQSVCMFFFFK